MTTAEADRTLSIGINIRPRGRSGGHQRTRDIFSDPMNPVECRKIIIIIKKRERDIDQETRDWIYYLPEILPYS